jgi:hypothetical protein
MSSTLANKLIVGLARMFGCSPLVAHILLMSTVTVGFGVLNPSGFNFFAEPSGALIWVGCCVLVVLATWATKGAYRSAWTKAEPWRK